MKCFIGRQHAQKVKTVLNGFLYTALAVWFFTGCSQRGHNFDASDEKMRVTSPSGKLDAVLVDRTWGGGPGGVDWYVYIVPKGSAIRSKNREVFLAGTLTGANLVWDQEHLLEIRYDIANIEQFRNLWALHEVQDTGPAGERDYLIEVRLVQSSPDFSLLTRDGKFRARN